MAVAVKNLTEKTVSTSEASLLPASIAGAAFVLAGFFAVTRIVPALWESSIGSWLGQKLSFVSGAGLVVVILFTLCALAVLGLSLLGSGPARGLKAGIFTVLAALGLGLFFGSPLVSSVQSLVSGFTFAGLVGSLVLAAIVAGVVYLAAWMFKDSSRLAEFEGQGWFSLERYKPMQGQMVRRLTLLGLLVLLGSGVYSLANSNLLLSGGRNWGFDFPGLGKVTLLPDVALTAPLILGALAAWLAYRLVNQPMFADFLIATEAEVNKISWPTRRSVIQDTIVVLATVILMTLFLFLVDLTWGWILSLKPVGVLHWAPAKPAVEKVVSPDQSY